jgi:hypothetical protein
MLRSYRPFLFEHAVGVISQRESPAGKHARLYRRSGEVKN